MCDSPSSVCRCEAARTSLTARRASATSGSAAVGLDAGKSARRRDERSRMRVERVLAGSGCEKTSSRASSAARAGPCMLNCEARRATRTSPSASPAAAADETDWTSSVEEEGRGGQRHAAGCGQLRGRYPPICIASVRSTASVPASSSRCSIATPDDASIRGHCRRLRCRTSGRARFGVWRALQARPGSSRARGCARSVEAGEGVPLRRRGGGGEAVS